MIFWLYLTIAFLLGFSVGVLLMKVICDRVMDHLENALTKELDKYDIVKKNKEK